MNLKLFSFSLSIFFQLLIFLLWINLDLENPFYFFQLDLFFFNVDFYFDSLSLLFLFLTAFIVNCCFIYNWNLYSNYQTEYYLCLLSVEFILFILFSTNNLLLFYIFFEAVLIPFFLLIGIVGYNKRKIHASFLLFFYTFFGSLLMLLGILYLYIEIGSFQNVVLLENSKFFSNGYLWWCFFISFAIKIPVFPFHLWLPEAHVESPTEGSVILAGILLKLGTYGLCRFLFLLMPNATYYYSSVVIVLCCVGVIYTSLMALRQVDVKKIIAYSSVGHMNFCTIGLFSFNFYSLQGSIFMMVGHGVISSALFFLIGMMYQRYHTKLIYHYSGLCYTMPIFYFFFFVFMFSNISFPMTVNFVSEFLMLIGIYICNHIVAFVCCLLGLFLGVLYNLYLFNKIFFCLPKSQVSNFFTDITLEECIVCVSLMFFNLLLGIYPSFFLNWLI